MKKIRDQLLAILDSGHDAESLPDRVQQLVERHGAQVYPVLLEVLTALVLEEHDASTHWRGIVDNWLELQAKLGRDISLQTSVCDYFSSIHGPLKAPRVIDTQSYEATVQYAYFDKLTGLYNRRYIDEVLERELALSKRHGSELSLLYFDIDNFKEINDTHGHQMGDLYLQLVADIICNAKRMEDIAGRFGGEEMMLILPRTSGQEALSLGRRILKRVENAALKHLGRRITTTISAGLATYPRFGETAEELLQSCDAALYRAKGAGKNTISFATIDKRRSLRVGLSLPIKIRSFGFNGSRPIAAFGQDISLGGFRFQTEERLEMGSCIEVLFQLPEQDSLMLIGEVVRVEDSPRGSNVGAELCFKRMDKLCQRAISTYITEHGRNG